MATRDDRVDAELRTLLAAVGWSMSPRWKLWARTEIVLGLAAVACGVLVAARPTPGDWPWESASAVALMTLGGYLALAGHRSHLYHSHNRLAAYLAVRMRPRPESDR